MRVLARHTRVMQLRRLIAEATASRNWAACSTSAPPGRTVDGLAVAFESLADRGALRLEDPQLAAERFNWSSQSGESGMLCGDTDLHDLTSLSRYADAGHRHSSLITARTDQLRRARADKNAAGPDYFAEITPVLSRQRGRRLHIIAIRQKSASVPGPEDSHAALPRSSAVVFLGRARPGCRDGPLL